MKSISWLTADYFIDVDLPIIRDLSCSYNIKWIIVINYNSTISYESFVKKALGEAKLSINFIYLKNRLRSLKIINEYFQIIQQAKSFQPDLYYLSFLGMPYALLLYKIFLPLDRCVIPCHNVTTPKGARSEYVARIYTHLWLSSFKNIQVFSKGQYKKLVEKYKNKNVLYAPLAIKDYGQPNKNVNKLCMNEIRFLFFGNIVEYKRVDILIEAAELLASKGLNFKVRIAGACFNWANYQSLIKHPEIFELSIRRIPNEDVADLFADSHYFVMPYQDIAQSGAITVAFRYNLPVICSNIEQFKEFVIDNETGFMFNNMDVNSLADKMEWVILNHKQIYSSVCQKESSFVHRNFSLNAIVCRYKDYFDKL